MESGSPKPTLKVLLCSPRGFCAGVVRAIESVERALAMYGAPVYVRHEIVAMSVRLRGLVQPVLSTLRSYPDYFRA